VCASELIEVYVGRGAARVRSVFELARKKAKGRCATVLFMDEIDALGSRGGMRNLPGTPNMGGHDETIQTVNQLLFELDGFGSQAGDDGVLLMGATNRYSSLDPALLRPGRFDRHIFLELPNAAVREEIMNLELRKLGKRVKLEGEERLGDLCTEDWMERFSGADVANSVNEAVYFALRRRQRAEKAAAADGSGRYPVQMTPLTADWGPSLAGLGGLNAAVLAAAGGKLGVSPPKKSRRGENDSKDKDGRDTPAVKKKKKSKDSKEAAGESDLSLSPTKPSKEKKEKKERSRSKRERATEEGGSASSSSSSKESARRQKPPLPPRDVSASRVDVIARHLPPPPEQDGSSKETAESAETGAQPVQDEDPMAAWNSPRSISLGRRKEEAEIAISVRSSSLGRGCSPALTDSRQATPLLTTQPDPAVQPPRRISQTSSLGGGGDAVIAEHNVELKSPERLSPVKNDGEVDLAFVEVQSEEEDSSEDDLHVLVFGDLLQGVNRTRNQVLSRESQGWPGGMPMGRNTF